MLFRMEPSFFAFPNDRMRPSHALNRADLQMTNCAHETPFFLSLGKKGTVARRYQFSVASTACGSQFELVAESVMALAVAGGPLNLRAVRPNIALNRTSVRRPSFCGLGTRRLI